MSTSPTTRRTLGIIVGVIIAIIAFKYLAKLLIVGAIVVVLAYLFYKFIW